MPLQGGPRRRVSLAPTFAGMAPSPLSIRKLADRSTGERAVRWDPETGEKFLYNPATPGFDHEPWPLAGIAIEGDTPKHTIVPTSFVDGGLAEGWITVENQRAVMRSGGPPDNPWKVDRDLNIPHVFSHGDALVLHTVDGDVRYRIVENPDKWPAEKLDDTAETGFGGEVRWFYELKLERGS